MANKIEALKQARDGLDVFPDLLRYAREGPPRVGAIRHLRGLLVGERAGVGALRLGDGDGATQETAGGS